MNSDLLEADMQHEAQQQFVAAFRLLMSNGEWFALLGVDAVQAFVMCVYIRVLGQVPPICYHAAATQFARALVYGLKSHVQMRQGPAEHAAARVLAHDRRVPPNLLPPRPPKLRPRHQLGSQGLNQREPLEVCACKSLCLRVDSDP